MANNYDDLFQQAGSQNGVDPLWLKAQATVESGLDPNAVNTGTQAQGIAQFIPATAKAMGVDPNDPNSAIDGQARLMAENLKRYGNIEDATRAYHGGTNTDNWGPKTQAYVQKVAATYKQLKGSQPMDASTDPMIDDLKSAFSGASAPASIADPMIDDLKSAFQSPASKPDTKISDGNTPHITINKPGILQRAGNAVVSAAKSFSPSEIGAGVVQGVEDVPASLARLPGISDAGAMAAHGVAALQGLPPDTIDRDQDQAAIAQGNKTSNAIFDAAHPGGWAQAGRVVGEIAGSAPAMALGAAPLEAAAEGTGALGTAARFMSGETNGLVAGTASKLAAGAGQGAATTALTNAGSDDSIQDQLSRNMKLGAGLRVLAPLVTGAGSMVVNKIKSLAAGPETQADNLLLQNLQRDGYTPETAAAKLQSMGPDATIGDLGENTRGLMRTVSGTPSEGKNAITDFVEKRQVGDDAAGDYGQSGRIVEAANKGLQVPNADPESAIAQLQTQRSDAAAPLYKEAFQNNKSVQSPVIDKILETDFGKSALEGARARMNTKMSLMGVPDAELAEQAQDAGLKLKGGVASGLKLQTLDLVKQDMDDQISAAVKQVGQGSMRKGQLQDMLDMRSKFVSELDANDSTAKAAKGWYQGQEGAYARARAAYAGPSKSMDAVELGQDFIKNPNSANAAALAKMTPGDRAFARQGVAGAIQDTLMNTPDGADAVKKLMGSPGKRQQLATFFDSPEDYKKFTDTVDAEAEKFKTFKSVTSGSPTIPRMNEQNDAGDLLDLAGHAVAGNHVGLVAKVANKLLAPKPFSAEQANALAPKLLPGPVQQETLGNLGVRNFDQTRRAAQSQALKAFGGAYGVPVTAIGVNRLRDVTGTK